MHSARPALAMIASLLRTGQMQVLTETIEQRRARIDSQIIFLAIHTQADRNGSFYGGHCFFRSGVAADSARDRSPSTGPAEASKFAIPKRERNLRRVDFPNCALACGVSFDWLRSAMEISLHVQSRIIIIIAFI